MAEGQHLLEWLVRCVDGAMDSNPERWRIEDDLAVFAFVEWGKGRRLKYANIQVVRTLMPLDEFYCQAGDSSQSDSLMNQCHVFAPVPTCPLPAKGRSTIRFGQ